MKKWLIVVLSIFLLFAIAGIGGYLYATKNMNTVNTQPIEFQIQTGNTLKNISTQLEGQGIIKHAVLFEYESKKLNLASSFKAGKYEILPNMTFAQLSQKFASGDVIKPKTVKVTIPEGYTVKQIAAELSKKGLVSEEDFLKTAYQWTDNTWFLQDLLVDEHRLDGFLFPATYEFEVGSDSATIIRKMLNTFDQRMKPYRVEIEKSTLSVREIVTLASLIEKEARHDEDRTKISSVIYNRLNKDMLLQIDSTVLFVIGHKQKVYYKDLKVDSPYNTYKYKGLPPSPIAAPGVPSIEAALRPVKTDYIYYVADKDTGYHHFAKTMKEHEENIDKYWKK